MFSTIVLAAEPRRIRSGLQQVSYSFLFVAVFVFGFCWNVKRISFFVRVIVSNLVHYDLHVHI
jgi:hypothetical protein